MNHTKWMYLGLAGRAGNSTRSRFAIRALLNYKLKVPRFYRSFMAEQKSLSKRPRQLTQDEAEGHHLPSHLSWQRHLPYR